MRRVSSSGIGNLLLKNTKIMLISILSREVTKVFVIGIQNNINLNKRYAEEKKDVALKINLMRKKLLGNQFHLIPRYALLIYLTEFNSLCLLTISKLFQKPLLTVNWKYSCSSFYTRVCNLIKQESIKTNDFNAT